MRPGGHPAADEAGDAAVTDRQLAALARRLDAVAGRGGDIPTLRGDLHAVTDRLERVEAEQNRVGADHQRVVRDMQRRMGEATEALVARVDAAEDRLRDEQRAALAGLRRELERLARVVRRSEGAALADLAPGPDLTVLAQRTEQGIRLAACRLDQPTREALAAAVRDWEAWQEDALHHRTAALEAGPALLAAAGAAPRRAGSGRTAARARRRATERRFRAAVAALDELAAVEAEVRRHADGAARRLAEDDEWQRLHGADIVAGEQAREQLAEGFRARVGRMIEHDELPPSWFASALGAPPRDADRWLATAVDILVYRAVFAVNDPVLALGAPPPDDAATERGAWYERLRAQLAD